MSLVALLLAGALAWSLSEYLLHRFAGHGTLQRSAGPLWWLTPLVVFILFREEHVAHHRDPLYFAPGWKKGLATLVLVPALGGLAALLVGAAGGLAFGLGYGAVYLAYEVLHRRIHTHAPGNRWFAWMRRHHLHHHVAPKVNHGVTSPLWDLAFSTNVEPHPVRLPRSLAPEWLRDPGTDAPRAEYARDYELVGR
jgi:hypothetical protein